MKATMAVVGLLVGELSFVPSSRVPVVAAPLETDCDVWGEWDPELQEYPCISPVVVQVGPRKPYTFTDVANGVVFDLDADGRYDRAAWTDPDSDTAFLALDHNGNGLIDDGSELFANHFKRNNQNGFAALGKLQIEEQKAGGSGGLDPNGADDRDAFFGKLLLWTDRNHNGVSEPSELEPFAKYFSNIQFWHATPNKYDEFGNRLLYSTSAQRRSDPSDAPWLTVYDVYLKADLGKGKKGPN